MELEIKNCNQIHRFELAVRLPAVKLIRILLRPVIKHTARCILLIDELYFDDHGRTVVELAGDIEPGRFAFVLLCRMLSIDERQIDD